MLLLAKSTGRLVPRSLVLQPIRRQIVSYSSNDFDISKKLIVASSTAITTAFVWSQWHRSVPVLCEGNEEIKTDDLMDNDSSPRQEFSLLQKCAAEAIGTGIIVGGGCGAVCATKYAAAGLSHLGIAAAFGMSVAVAVYATRDVSGAHLNPAITCSLMVNDPSFDKSLAVPYIFSQVVGAATMAGVNYVGYNKAIAALHAAQKVKPATVASSAIFNGAFHMIPNQAMVATTMGALAAEIVLTTGLGFGVYALTDPKSSVPPDLAPALIGITVAALVTPGIPLTGCGMNPARDVGPRLVAAIAGGLGKAAFLPGWWVYTAGPIVGAIAGGALYKAVFGRD